MFGTSGVTLTVSPFVPACTGREDTARAIPSASADALVRRARPTTWVNVRSPEGWYLAEGCMPNSDVCDQETSAGALPDLEASPGLEVRPDCRKGWPHCKAIPTRCPKSPLVQPP